MSSAGKVELEWLDPGTIPAPASIVWCNFPEHLAPDVPGPKSRPGLIFKVRYATKLPEGRYYVQVAYGTTKLKTDRRPHDFTIGNSATLDVLRLPSATRFDLDYVVWMPWASPWFIPRNPADRYSTPVMSVLPESLQENLRWTMVDRERRGMNGHFRSPAPEATTNPP